VFTGIRLNSERLSGSGDRLPRSLSPPLTPGRQTDSVGAQPHTLCGGVEIPYNRSMSGHPTNFEGSVTDAIRDAITAKIANAQAVVTGGGGHFSIVVVSTEFAGKSMLESQRLVYGAIAHLMKGDMAPVHAVDSLVTRTTP